MLGAGFLNRRLIHVAANNKDDNAASTSGRETADTHGYRSGTRFVSAHAMIVVL
jgi:hypothetical protein